MHKIAIYTTANPVALGCDGLADKSTVIAGVLSCIELNCYEINFENKKDSEVRVVAGKRRSDDNVYIDTMQVVTERYKISDFGQIQSNLISVLQKDNKYIDIIAYEFVPFSNKVFPFEIQNFAIERAFPFKYFNLDIVKNNNE
jgi:hypothetical protein